MGETIPQHIGPYAIIRPLVERPHRRSFLSKHPARSKQYVVVTLFTSPLVDEQMAEAFLKHARALKKLVSRTIVEMLDFGLVPGTEASQTRGYHVTRYSESKSIDQHFQRGQAQKVDEIKSMLYPLTDALRYAHTMPLLHANLHPGNILLGERNEPLLTGFAPLPPALLNTAMLDPDAIPYMSPEQLQEREITPASDQYALAIMVYEWLCGRRPYTATDREGLLAQQLHEALPRPGSFNKALSSFVDAVLLKALSLDPAARFPHAHTFANEYLRALMGFPMAAGAGATPAGSPPAQDTSPAHQSNEAPTPLEYPQNPVGADLSGTPPIYRPASPITNYTSTHQESEHDIHDDVPLDDDNEGKGDPGGRPGMDNEQRPKARRFSTGSIVDLEQRVTADLRDSGILSQKLSGYEERLAQVEMASAVAQALTEQHHAIIEAATGTGKALDVDTPIPTLTGWKRMGDLVVGDFVFDDKGHPTRVVRAFDVMHERPCYEVKFSDGSSLIADAEHEWASYTTVDRSRIIPDHIRAPLSKNFITSAGLAALDQFITLSQADDNLSMDEAATLIGGHKWSVSQAAREVVPINPGKRPARYQRQALLTAVRNRLEKDLYGQRRDGRVYTVVTTKEMAATLTVSSTARANHAIAVAGPLALPEALLPIAPYFLGVWLGDGSSRSNQIISADPSMIPEIEKDGYSVRKLKSHPYLYAVDDENGKATNRWQPGMTGRLRNLNLLLNKHIPPIYLRASEQQRRALLAGLLDTDGTVSRHGAVEFTTTSQQLAQDVYELVCSLGFRPSLRCGRARLKGKDCGPKWTLAFTTNQQVFRLERKIRAHQERLRNYTSKRNLFRYVIEVREVPSRPVRCIQVDSESHLYLAGRSMIPTHNSLAYLLPIVRSGRGAIVSTANKALQEQLFFKDIPFVQKNIEAFEAALVKGMSNYICLDRLENAQKEGEVTTKNPDFSRLLNIVKEFELETSGDFETLGFTVPGDLRAKISADRDQCAWTECNFYSQCYVRQMKERAEKAQIVVVNHTLLLLDAASKGHILPQRDVTVVDEAHHLEEEATRAFTVTVNQSQIYALLSLRRLRDHSPASLHDKIKEQMLQAWSALEQVANPGSKGRANLREPLQDGLTLASLIDQLASALEMQRPLFMPTKEETLYDKLVNRARGLAENIRQVFSVSLPEKFVYYVERVTQPNRRISPLEVSAAPLDVAHWLRENLFDTTHVIATSATLTTVGKDPARPEERGPTFVYFRKRVGLDAGQYRNVQECILPLAFDYEQNALLYLPRHLPQPVYGPDSLGYTKAIADEMMRLVEASRGRAFLLFSSRRMLEQVFDLFCANLPSHLNFRLLRQGDMSRIEMVRAFRESEGAVLFGLKSFWEGVDIAGEALSLVVIDKMPFDPPDDPVQEARVALMKARGEDWFGSYVLPQAVLRLKQGLGRLLRTREDRGVMALLDTRLHTKGYGRLVLNALPPARKVYDIRDVQRFFEQGNAPF